MQLPIKRVSSEADIRGKRFQQVESNFIKVQAGHNLLGKTLTLCLASMLIYFCSWSATFSGKILAGLLTNSAFNHELEFVVSGAEVSIYILTLILTSIYAIERRFIASILVGTILLPLAASPLPNNLWLSVLAFSLVPLFAWIGAVSFGIIFTILVIACGNFGSFLGAMVVALSITNQTYLSTSENPRYLELILALAVVISGILITCRTIVGSTRFDWLREKAIFYAATWGTSFYGVDLTDVRFDESNLRFTDFRKANLTRTSFRDVTGLHLARLQGTILEDCRVRKLLATSKGQGQDFTEADFRAANLQEADLREAVLVRSQLLDTDLSGANLTDACIQNWNINPNTRFTGVECKRVYLKRSPSGHFLEPKPDSGEFLPGEFEKWVTDIRDTIDLIFQNGLNWRAFAFSLTQTAIDHKGLDLSVRSIENKGDGVVVAKVGVSLETNKTAIHREMTEHYQGAVATIEAGYELVLQAKDEEIDRLTQFYGKQQQFIQGLVSGIAETKGQVLVQGENNRVYLMDQAGDIMENSSQNVSAGGNIDLSSGASVSIGGDMTGSTVNLGDLSGQVSNTIQQLQGVGETDELAKILTALQESIEGDRSLTSDQQQQALEAVATLAEEGSKPAAQRSPKFCSMAVNALRGITSATVEASKLATALKTLLPKVIGLLGL
jgi:uncharacterized protein YjbI with pentapeptide repeats